MKKKSWILGEIIFVVLFFCLYSFAAGEESPTQETATSDTTTVAPDASGVPPSKSKEKRGQTDLEGKNPVDPSKALAMSGPGWVGDNSTQTSTQ